MNAGPSSRFFGSRLEDYRVLGLNQSVRHQFLEQRQQRLNILLRIDELDAKRHVLRIVDSTFVAMYPVVRPEARLRAQYRRAGYALLEQQRNNFTTQKVATRARILVQMNRYFLRRAKIEHTLCSFPATVLRITSIT